MTKKMKRTSSWRLGIVVSRFNEFVTKRLLDGCLQEIKRQHKRCMASKIVWVPGAFELPLVTQKLVRRRDIDAVIALGAVIRGETIHFELVSQAASDGILKVGLKAGKPVIFGVITTNTVKQAYARSQARGENKGRDAVQAAVEMLEVLKTI